MKKNVFYIIISLLLFNCELLFVENISDEKVILIAPSNKVEIPKGIIKFQWESVSLDSLNYHIQIATPNFSIAKEIFIDTLITGTVISKDIDIGAYQWRVKAINSDYATTYTTQSFTVK